MIPKIVKGCLAALSVVLIQGCDDGGDGSVAVIATPPTPTVTAIKYSEAVVAYRQYVIEECDALVQQTQAFTEAVKTGNEDDARRLYVVARTHYERIEPIAESLGNLDPDIDAREGDAPADEWRGFHRIEKFLWSAPGADENVDEFADHLLNDVQILRARLESVDIEPALMVVGSVELLNEVSSSKVTGEEERYSHTDLYDIAANVDGAKQIYSLLTTSLEHTDPILVQTLNERFAAVYSDLDAFKTTDGFMLYQDIEAAQIRNLSNDIDALAEPLSRMGAALDI